MNAGRTCDDASSANADEALSDAEALRRRFERERTGVGIYQDVERIGVGIYQDVERTGVGIY